MRLWTLLSLFSPCMAIINPILPGWNPDPSILRVHDDYFIVTSTFEHFPGHPIYHSKDLMDWKLIGHALNRPSQLSLMGTPPNAGIWAPGLRYHNGTFYLSTTTRYVYTAELRLFPRSFYVKTDDIFSNNWSDPVYFDALGYDADLFWDTNGDVYNTWAGINNAVDKIYGIWQNKIDLDTGTSLTEAQLIFNGTLPLNASSRPEGPHVYFINDTYYLLIAEGGTGLTHRATIQRGPSPSGPWENNPANPILFNGADLSLPVQCTGHADMVEGADGQWWGVALGTRVQNGSFDHQQLGRETFLFPVTWEDGWPIFNNNEPLSENISTILNDDRPLESFSTNFIQESLDDSFYFLRTPYKKFYTLSESDGLSIRANSYALGDRDTPAVIFRRQASYSESFETQLDFSNPQNRLQEAGITVFYDDYLHNDIAVTGADNDSGDRYIVVRTAVVATQVGPLTLTPLNSTTISTTFVKLNSTTDPVKLRAVARPDHYILSYAEGDGEFIDAGSVDASALTLPPAGDFIFKGAMFGAYNTGTGRPSLLLANFKYWTQTPDGSY